MEKLIEVQCDVCRDDFESVEHMIRNGCTGYSDYSDMELFEEYRDTFDNEDNEEDDTFMEASAQVAQHELLDEEQDRNTESLQWMGDEAHRV